MKAILSFSLWTTCLFGCMPLLLWGQTDTIALHKQRDILTHIDLATLPTIGQEVLSASRSTKKAEDLPVTVHVITQQEIRLNGYVTLVDVLKSVPGMKVSQPGSAEDGETFLMRGLFGNSYAKILINNIPIQPSVVAGMNLGAQLPIRQAERIEIIYGPGSAVYGADAAAGVINIVTKMPQRSLYAQADAALGDHGYSFLNFMVGGKAGKNKNVLKYSFFGSRQARQDMNVRHKSDVYLPTNWLGIQNIPLTTEILQDTLAYYQGTLEQPKINELPQESHHIGVQFRFRNWEFTYHDMYRQDHASIGRTTYLYSYAFPQVFWGDKIKRGTLSFQKSWKKVSLNSYVSYLRYRMNKSSSTSVNYFNGTSDGIAYVYSGSDDIQTEHILAFQPKEKIELVTGITFRASGNLPRTNDLLDPFNTDDYRAFGESLPPLQPLYGTFGYNPIKYANLATFVQLYYSLGKFNFIAGARFDRDVRLFSQDNGVGNLALSGVNLTPRLAGIYKLNAKTTIHASFGTSFRAPSPTLSYGSIASPFSANSDSIIYSVVPNPRLEAESMEAYELGVRHHLNKNIYINLSGYLNQIDNLITRTISPLDTIVYPLASSATRLFARVAANGEGLKSSLWGVQATFNFKNLLPNRFRLYADLNLTYAKGKETLPKNAGQLDDFRMMPRLSSQLNVAFYPHKSVYIRLENVLMSGWQSRFLPNVALAELYENFPDVTELIKDNRYRVDGYYNLDVLVRILVNTNFDAFLKVKNVFNSEYGGIGATGLDADLPYNPQMGINVQVGLSYLFE